jgi:thiol:disulfide interchange protein
MKINITKIGVALLAVGICIWSAQVRAQTTTTVTTTKGAFTEYVPGSETVVMRTETNPAPSRYVVTKQTKIVDESGAPVAIERISAGSPLAVEYTGTGERLIASRIVVQRAAAVTAPVTTAPVTTQDTATTTTTTRPLTHDEKHELKEQREHRKEALKEEIEKKKDALEEAKDKLDDDH